MVVLCNFVHLSLTGGNAEEEGQATTHEMQTVDKKGSKSYCLEDQRICTRDLTFRHRASCILGQAFRYSPENAFYIFVD